MRPRIRLLLALGLGLLLLMQADRLLFLGVFGRLGDLARPEVRQALVLGLRFDLRLDALLLFPAFVLLREGREDLPRRPGAALSLALALGTFLGLLVVVHMDDQAARPWALAFLGLSILDWRLFRGRGLRNEVGVRRVWGAFAVLVFTVLLLVDAFDLGAYGYVHSPLSRTLLPLLGNPADALRMVWQSYPVLRGAAAVVLVVGAGAWGMGRLWAWAERGEVRPSGRWQGVLACALLLLAIWGRFNGYPLRWGDAFSRFEGPVAHLSLNPALFLLETLQDDSGGYDLDRVRGAAPALAAYFGAPAGEGADGRPRLARPVQPRPLVPPGSRPNLVFLHLESLGAYKCGAFGNPVDPTPAFDALAREGLLFDQVYAPAENTSRAMFALLFGIPDTSPGARNSASRNPRLVDQRSLVNELGYENDYLLGGTGSWAQIRATLKHNLRGLQVFEEGAFGDPVVDVWGIADDDLLRHARERFGAHRAPFFALVQLAGNHPPFSLPSHKPDFPRRSLGPGELAAGQFASQEEFDSLRLMDWSLGRFFEAARKEPWFANTLFVLYGDHGVARGSRDDRYGDLRLASHHVPFLVYGPGLIAPGRVSTVGTQMDVMPTLLSLLGVPCENRTLGKDLRDPRYREEGAAFTFSVFAGGSAHGLIQGRRYLVVEGGRSRLYDLDDPGARDLADLEPQRARAMGALAEGFLQWSRYLMANNRP